MTRRYLTAKERLAMLDAQGGMCATCECSVGPFEADHSTPHAWDNAKPDQLLCVRCHRAKTKADVKAIAKVRRIAGGKTQYDKRKRKGPQIKSRGFDKSLSKKMDGSVVKK